jgi:hypothetical protein
MVNLLHILPSPLILKHCKDLFVFLLRSHFGVSLIIFLHTVGLLGRVISSSQGLYLNTGQHKQNKHTHTHTHTHTKHPCPEWNSNIRSRLPSEETTCLMGSIHVRVWLASPARLPWPALRTVGYINFPNNFQFLILYQIRDWSEQNYTANVYRVSCLTEQTQADSEINLQLI